VTDVITFFVPGIPVPQGSKTLMRRGGKTWMVDANADALRKWRATVANRADVGLTFDSPVVVGYEFLLPKPKRPKFLQHAVKPDLDKLIRAVNDGLVDGGLLSDDSRIFKFREPTKRYVDAGEQPGVHIHVEAW